MVKKLRTTLKKKKSAFELLCWRRLLRVLWPARRSNQSILKEINPEYSLEGLILKLKYFWPLDTKNWLIGKDSDAGKGKRRRGWQRMKWLDSTTNSMDMNLSKLREMVEDRGAWHSVIHEVAELDMTDRTTTIKSSFLLTPFSLFDIFLLFQKALLL